MSKESLYCRALVAVMHVTFSHLIISIFFVGVTFAHEGYSQELLNKRLSIRAVVQPLKKVLNEIEKSAEIRFIYNSNLIKTENNVSITMENALLGDVLKVFSVKSN